MARRLICKNQHKVKWVIFSASFRGLITIFQSKKKRNVFIFLKIIFLNWFPNLGRLNPSKYASLNISWLPSWQINSRNYIHMKCSLLLIIHVMCILTGSKESSQQRLLAHLFAKYDGDGRPSSDRSRAVLVSFGAKLVRIIQLVSTNLRLRLLIETILF